MKIRSLEIPELKIVELPLFHDARGHVVEMLSAKHFAALGLPVEYRQDNRSVSKRGVVRGLHYQLKHPQGKLIACTRGSVWDVAVDIRVGSPTFRRWVAVELSEDKPELLWIPEGFAHGFCVLSESAYVEYKCTASYGADDQHGILWSDQSLGVTWPVSSPTLSDRDANLPSLDRAELPQFSRSAEHRSVV